MTKRTPMLASDGCTTHRDRCNFGHAHSWNLGGFIETDEDGSFVRVGYGEYRRDLLWCSNCNGVCYVVDEAVAERRARIRRQRLESFEEGLRWHLANGPDTWVVFKQTDRLWHIVNASGHCVVAARTKRQALEHLTGGPYWRSWHDHDEWYRGTSRDPRNRKFTDEEQQIIDRVLAEPDSEPVPDIGPERFTCGCSISEHLHAPHN